MRTFHHGFVEGQVPEPPAGPCQERALSTPDPLSSARADVLEKAERLVAHWESALGGMIGASRESQDLRVAVRVLRQLQQPQGKKPEEVPLGATFRFVGHKDPDTYRMIEAFGERAAYRDDGHAFRFLISDRIIPIEDQP